ncbi:MAG: type I methionyl aminopeptidase [Myxococcota bacterium]|nr:type I methionyl aminopeptidase [Myxococcota bacterium]
MPFEILAPADRERMRVAGRMAAATLRAIGLEIRPGMTTADIDARVRADTRARGGVPSQLGYHGFPAAVCTSVNEVVCHGIPSPQRALRDGDIVNVDVTTYVGGFHGDTSATFFVGEPSPEARHLVETARRCRDAGIAVVRHGARLGDIGAAVEELARAAGLSVVRDFGGHGIGREMHQAPHVSHVGRRGAGPRLVAGMAITIEPMLNLGRADVIIANGEWNVVTADGSWSAQFEHTLLVERDGAEILTLPGPDALSDVRSAAP